MFLNNILYVQFVFIPLLLSGLSLQTTGSKTGVSVVGAACSEHTVMQAWQTHWHRDPDFILLNHLEM